MSAFVKSNCLWQNLKAVPFDDTLHAQWILIHYYTANRSHLHGHHAGIPRHPPLDKVCRHNSINTYVLFLPAPDLILHHHMQHQSVQRKQYFSKACCILLFPILLLRLFHFATSSRWNAFLAWRPYTCSNVPNARYGPTKFLGQLSSLGNLKLGRSLWHPGAVCLMGSPMVAHSKWTVLQGTLPTPIP